MKKISSMLFVAALGMLNLLFASNVVIMPFTGNINYATNSKKDTGNIYGMYLKSFNNFSNNYIEFNYEYDKIKYKNAPDNYTQNSISVIYNMFPNNRKYKTKIGFNYLNINDENSISKTDNIYIFGTEFYSNKSIYGMDIYYTKLNKNSIEHSWQFSPYITFYTGKFNRIGSFYTKVQYNYISLKNKIEIDNKKHYQNFDISLINYNPNGYTTTVSASFGKSSYKVDKGGFVLYNTGDVINHSYDITENIAFGKKKDKFIILDIKKTNVKDYDKYGNINNNLNNYSFAIMGGILF